MYAVDAIALLNVVSAIVIAEFLGCDRSCWPLRLRSLLLGVVNAIVIAGG